MIHRWILVITTLLLLEGSVATTFHYGTGVSSISCTSDSCSCLDASGSEAASCIDDFGASFMPMTDVINVSSIVQSGNLSTLTVEVNFTVSTSGYGTMARGAQKTLFEISAYGGAAVLRIYMAKPARKVNMLGHVSSSDQTSGWILSNTATSAVRTFSTLAAINGQPVQMSITFVRLSSYLIVMNFEHDESCVPAQAYFTSAVPLGNPEVSEMVLNDDGGSFDVNSVSFMATPSVDTEFFSSTTNVTEALQMTSALWESTCTLVAMRCFNDTEGVPSACACSRRKASTGGRTDYSDVICYDAAPNGILPYFGTSTALSGSSWGQNGNSGLYAGSNDVYHIDLPIIGGLNQMSLNIDIRFASSGGDIPLLALLDTTNQPLVQFNLAASGELSVDFAEKVYTSTAMIYANTTDLTTVSVGSWFRLTIIIADHGTHQKLSMSVCKSSGCTSSTTWGWLDNAGLTSCDFEMVSSTLPLSSVRTAVIRGASPATPHTGSSTQLSVSAVSTMRDVHNIVTDPSCGYLQYLVKEPECTLAASAATLKRHPVTAFSCTMDGNGTDACNCNNEAALDPYPCGTRLFSEHGCEVFGDVPMSYFSSVQDGEGVREVVTLDGMRKFSGDLTTSFSPSSVDISYTATAFLRLNGTADTALLSLTRQSDSETMMTIEVVTNGTFLVGVSDTGNPPVTASAADTAYRMTERFVHFATDAVVFSRWIRMELDFQWENVTAASVDGISIEGSVARLNVVIDLCEEADAACSSYLRWKRTIMWDQPWRPEGIVLRGTKLDSNPSGAAPLLLDSVVFAKRSLGSLPQEDMDSVLSPAQYPRGYTPDEMYTLVQDLQCTFGVAPESLDLSNSCTCVDNRQLNNPSCLENIPTLLETADGTSWNSYFTPYEGLIISPASNSYRFRPYWESAVGYEMEFSLSFEDTFGDVEPAVLLTVRNSDNSTVSILYDGVTQKVIVESTTAMRTLQDGVVVAGLSFELGPMNLQEVDMPFSVCLAGNNTVDSRSVVTATTCVGATGCCSGSLPLLCRRTFDTSGTISATDIFFGGVDGPQSVNNTFILQSIAGTFTYIDDEVRIVGNNASLQQECGVGVSSIPSPGFSFSSTLTPSVTGTQTASASFTPTTTPTLSASKSEGFSESNTPSGTFSPTMTITSTVTSSNSGSSTHTPSSSSSASLTRTNTVSPTVSRTASKSGSQSPSMTASRTASKTGSPSASSSHTGSETPSVTASKTPTPSVTGSVTGSRTQSVTASASRTASVTASKSATSSATATVTASRTSSVTASASGTTSVSTSMTATASATASVTGSRTSSVTASASGTASVSTSMTATASATASVTGSRTSSVTASASGTASVSASMTATSSATASVTGSRTSSVTASASGTASVSASMTATSSATASVTGSRTSSVTASSSGTGSPSASMTATSSATASVTGSRTSSVTASSSGTGSSSASMTATSSATASVTGSRTSSVTASSSGTASVSASMTVTSSTTASVTGSRTPSVTASSSGTASVSASMTTSSSATASVTGSSTSSVTASSSGTGSSSASMTTTSSTTASVTGSSTPSVTVSSSGTASVSASMTTTSSTTASVTGSSTPSVTTSSSGTASVSASMTATSSATASVTGSITPSVTTSSTGTASVSASMTATSSATASVTGSSTSSVTVSASGTASVSASMTATSSATASVTGSSTSSVTVSASGTASVSASTTATTTVTASVTVSSTPSVTTSASGTASVSASMTTTSSTSASVTGSSAPSLTATSSGTASVTVSLTSKSSATVSPSVSGTTSATRSVSSTPSVTLTMTSTSSATVSASASGTSSVSPTASATATGSTSSSVLPSNTGTPSASGSTSETETSSASATVSATSAQSATPSASPTHSTTGTTSGTGTRSASVTITVSTTETGTPSGSQTPVSSGSVSSSVTDSTTATGSASQTRSGTSSVSTSPSISRTVSGSVSSTLSPTVTSTSSSSLSLSVSMSISGTITETSSVSQTDSATASVTASPSVTLSPSTSVSASEPPSSTNANSLTPSYSQSVTTNASNSESSSQTESVSASTTGSITTTATISGSRSASGSVSVSETVSASLTQSASGSDTPTPSAPGSETASMSSLATGTPSQSIFATGSSSKTVSASSLPSTSVTLSSSASTSVTSTHSASTSGTVTGTPSETATQSPSSSLTAPVSLSSSPSTSVTSSVSGSETSSPSTSASETETLTSTTSPTASPSGSLSSGSSPSATPSGSKSASATALPSPSGSITSTAAVSMSPSTSVTGSESPTAAVTATASASETTTSTGTPSLSAPSSSTVSPSPSVAPTATGTSPTSTSDTVTMTPSRTASLSSSQTVSSTMSSTASGSSRSTSTSTGTPSALPSSTVTSTRTQSLSPSLSGTASITSTGTPNDSPSSSISSSASPTHSVTTTRSSTGTLSHTVSGSGTQSSSPSSSSTLTTTASHSQSVSGSSPASQSVSVSAMATKSSSMSRTTSGSSTETSSPTGTKSPSSTASGSLTVEPSSSPSSSPSPSADSTHSASHSGSAYPSASESKTGSGSSTTSPLSTPSVSSAATGTQSMTISMSTSVSLTSSGTPVGTPTHTATHTAAPSPGIVVVSKSTTPSSSPTASISPAVLQVVSAKFSSDGSGISVTFDHETNTAGMGVQQDCRAFLANETLTVIGSAAKCVWSSSEKVIIRFGSGPTIFLPEVADELHIVPNVLYGKGYSTLAFQGPVRVSPPDSLPPLELVIGGPRTLTPCTDVYLYTSDSIGMQLSFAWNIYGGGVALGESLALEGEEIRVSQEELQTVGILAPFTVVVSAHDVFGQSLEMQVQIDVNVNSVGTLTISGPQTLNVKSSTMVSLKSKFEVDACANSSVVSRTYSWTVSNTMDNSMVPGLVTNASSLYIPPNALQANSSFIASLVLSVGTSFGTNVMNTAVYLNVGVQELVAKIAGADEQQVFPEGSIVLDSSPSYDPDSLTGSENFSWTCTSMNGTSCDGAFSRRRRTLLGRGQVNVDVTSLPAGKYIFSVTYSKGRRVATASTTIEIVGYPVISVSLDAVDQFIVPGKDFIVSAVLPASEGGCTITGSFEWVVVCGAINVKDVDRLRRLLVLQYSKIPDGVEGCKFTVSAAACSKQGVSSGTFRIAPKAHSGQLKIGSPEVHALQKIDISTKGWLGGTPPYLYQFFSKTERDTQYKALSSVGGSSTKVLVPSLGKPSWMLNFRVDLIDSLGTKSSAYLQVLVNETTSDPSKQLSALADVANTIADEGDSESLLAAANQIGASLQNVMGSASDAGGDQIEFADADEGLSCSDNDDCQNGGVCMTTGSCACKEGFSGTLCSTNKKEICLLRGCDRGVCLKSGECSCQNGWAGPSCNLTVLDYCEASGKCKNGGTCGIDGKCTCKAGFTGKVCELTTEAYEQMNNLKVQVLERLLDTQDFSQPLNLELQAQAMESLTAGTILKGNAIDNVMGSVDRMTQSFASAGQGGTEGVAQSSLGVLSNMQSSIAGSTELSLREKRDNVKKTEQILGTLSLGLVSNKPSGYGSSMVAGGISVSVYSIDPSQDVASQAVAPSNTADIPMDSDHISGSFAFGAGGFASVQHRQPVVSTTLYSDDPFSYTSTASSLQFEVAGTSSPKMRTRVFSADVFDPLSGEKVTQFGDRPSEGVKIILNLFEGSCENTFSFEECYHYNYGTAGCRAACPSDSHCLQASTGPTCVCNAGFIPTTMNASGSAVECVPGCAVDNADGSVTDTCGASGLCVNGTCLCNVPYYGPGCRFRAECRYFDDDAGSWSTDGCEPTAILETNGQTLLECSCSHLSSFAGFAMPVVVLPDFSKLADLQGEDFIIVGILTCVYAIYIALALYGRHLDKRQFKSVIPFFLAKLFDVRMRLHIRKPEVRRKVLEKKNQWRTVPRTIYETLRGSHPLISYVDKPRANTFTRPQRATVLATIVLGTLAIDGLLSEADAESFVDFVMIGVMAGSLIFPPIFLLKFLFRYSKPAQTLDPYPTTSSKVKARRHWFEKERLRMRLPIRVSVFQQLTDLLLRVRLKRAVEAEKRGTVVAPVVNSPNGTAHLSIGGKFNPFKKMSEPDGGPTLNSIYPNPESVTESEQQSASNKEQSPTMVESLESPRASLFWKRVQNGMSKKRSASMVSPDSPRFIREGNGSPVSPHMFNPLDMAATIAGETASKVREAVNPSKPVLFWERLKKAVTVKVDDPPTISVEKPSQMENPISKFTPKPPAGPKTLPNRPVRPLIYWERIRNSLKVPQIRTSFEEGSPSEASETAKKSPTKSDTLIVVESVDNSPVGDKPSPIPRRLSIDMNSLSIPRTSPRGSSSGTQMSYPSLGSTLTEDAAKWLKVQMMQEGDVHNVEDTEYTVFKTDEQGKICNLTGSKYEDPTFVRPKDLSPRMVFTPRSRPTVVDMGDASGYSSDEEEDSVRTTSKRMGDASDKDPNDSDTSPVLKKTLSKRQLKEYQSQKRRKARMMENDFKDLALTKKNMSTLFDDAQSEKLVQSCDDKLAKTTDLHNESVLIATGQLPKHRTLFFVLFLCLAIGGACAWALIRFLDQSWVVATIVVEMGMFAFIAYVKMSYVPKRTKHGLSERFMPHYGLTIAYGYAVALHMFSILTLLAYTVQLREQQSSWLVSSAVGLGQEFFILEVAIAVVGVLLKVLISRHATKVYDTIMAVYLECCGS